MSKLENAIRNLTPEQRALLELRLKKKREQGAGAQQGIVQRADADTYPLSAGQRRLLSLEQLTPGTARYNITEAYRLMGPLDVPALSQSVIATLERHHVLRAAFLLENGQWRQEIRPCPEEALLIKNLSHLAATQRLNMALSLVSKDLNTAFDLEKGYLVRFRLIRLATNDHIFFVTMHHLVSDGWSFDLLLKEVAQQYGSTINQTPLQLPELPVQYADFAQWQKGWLASGEADKQRAYWEKEFENGLNPITLPSDRDPASTQSTLGASKRIILAPRLVEMLMEVSLTNKLTPFSLFLAAFKCLLYRYSGQQELAVCVPVAGRNRVEVESLIGYFNNLLILKTQLEADAVYADVANHISGKAAEAGDHQNIPFEMVAALPSLRRVPVTRVFFTFQNALSHAFQLPGMEIEAIDLEIGTADFDLAIYVEQKGDDVVVSSEYRSELFKEETMSELLANYVTILRAIAEHPETRLSELPTFDMPRPLQETPADPANCSLEAKQKLQTRAASDDETDDQHTPSSITLTVNDTVQSGDTLPIRAEAHLTRPLVAPPDDIEQILTRIWERALGITNIGLHDNFFELGGHSLMAVDIFNEIQKYISDTDLPLAALLEAPTIAQLAERIRNGEDEWSPLAIIQAGRASIPLFCFHGAGGNVLLYRDLAIQLGPDQTVYGLQSQGMDGQRPILARIEDMAALYVKAIRKAQPQGPYLLLGYCMGGTIALEVAQRLRAQGQQVELLALLETYNWYNEPKESFFDKLVFYYEKLKFHIQNYFLLSKTERKIFRDEKLAELKRRRKIWQGKLAVKLNPRKAVPKTNNGFNPRALAEVWRTNDEAIQHYAPREYAGRIMHFIPMSEYSVHKNKGLGWESIAHELETHVLSTYPAGMLVQPFVKELAQTLRAEIYDINQRIHENEFDGYDAAEAYGEENDYSAV